MLYVTTRDKSDAYTTPHAFRADRAPDGGFYLPFRMPCFSQQELEDWKGKSFAQTVADILNLFFSCRLTSWDVEFSAGRYPVKLPSLQQRICIGELWHNQSGDYIGLEKTLALKIDPSLTKPVSWVKIAVRIAVLFGIYTEMCRNETLSDGDSFDIALHEADLVAVTAAWYSRKMGLPIENIVIGCSENSSVWDLLHVGEVRLDQTTPGEAERLVHGALGIDEVNRFIDACEKCAEYSLQPEMHERLRSGVFASVVSESRVDDTIPNVYRTATYTLDRGAAQAYSALQDYRAKCGTSRVALVLSEQKPGDI